MNDIVNPIIILVSIGVLSGLLLYIVSKAFKVEENVLVQEVLEMLPGANCGGCGFPGCAKFADTLVNSENIDSLFCSPAGNDQMKAIAAKLGKTVADKGMSVAVVKCAGSCDKRPKTTKYEGIQSCAYASQLYKGETDCSYGCLGLGDCVTACNFDAIYIDTKTGLPVVDTQKCTSCGMCVTACPKKIIEIRKTNKKDIKVFVACSNKDKGAVAKKSCDVACIGCKKCQKACPHDAITVQDNLAYIDANACKLCNKCVDECPTSAIQVTNSVRKQKKDEAHA